MAMGWVVTVIRAMVMVLVVVMVMGGDGDGGRYMRGRTKQAIESTRVVIDGVRVCMA